jgi:hypothetical protein
MATILYYVGNVIPQDKYLPCIFPSKGKMSNFQKTSHQQHKSKGNGKWEQKKSN